MGPQTKATILLIVVTGFYTFFTFEIANITDKQFDLLYQQNLQNNRPYIFLEKFELEPEEFEGLQYVMTLRNSGSIPARIKTEKYCYNTEQNCAKDIEEMIVFPNSDGSHVGAIGNPIDLKKEIEKNTKVKLIYKLNYWAISDIGKKKTYFYEIHIELFRDPNNPSNFLHKNLFVNAN